jgi:carbohydrate-selective porin OprB
MESQLSGGLTYRVGQNRSEVGAAVSFQQPAIDTLDRQTTYDLYFRWQVTPKLAVTPSLQFLHNPALSPERKTVVLGGLRIRYTP